MNPDQAKQFLSKLGITSVSKNGDWMQCACPMAPWTHKNGKDNNPSFGMYAKGGEESYFKCFACDSGSALELMSAVEYHGKKTGYPADRHYNIAEARIILDAESIDLPVAPEYSEFPTASTQVFTPWSEYWLDSFQSAVQSIAAMSYLEGRGVQATQVQEFNLKFDPDKQMILFPYRNVWGKLAGARGRSIDPEAEGHKKHFDYTYKQVNNSKLVWYNEQCLQLDGPVVVVEGQFDALRVAERYPKVLATLTAKPSYEKFMKLTTQDRVILIPDNDTTGQKTVVEYKNFLAKYNTRLSVLTLPEGIKDAGDCHPDWLFDQLKPLLGL
jgi:hypothetical protein